MIRHIVALDNQRGIAKNGQQPWDLPTDTRYFLTQTKKYGANVLRGRAEFEMFGHPLPGRRNFVVTHDSELNGAVVVTDLARFLAEFHEDLWVVGGVSIYAQTLKQADELYITEIAADFNCDQYYPEFADQFYETWRSEPMTENGYRFIYTTYNRKRDN